MMTVVTTYNQSIQNKFSIQNFILFLESLKKNDLIPRPKSKVSFEGWDKEKEVLYYKTQGKYIEKTDFAKSLKRLNNFGFINREWFNNNMSTANAMPCNYTTMGGLLELYGLVEYIKPATYQLKEPYLSMVLKKNLKEALVEVNNIEKGKLQGKDLNELLDEY